MQANDRFAAIRPYNDDEVPGVIDRLTRHREFIEAIARLRFPRASRVALALLRPLIGFVLRRQAVPIRSVMDFQRIVETYMTAMIRDKTAGLTVNGLEHLGGEGGWLLIGNHRDIALDAAFVNYSLFHNGQGTVRIAIGDNLLTRDYVSDLMRLNKSFIVVRSAKGPRQQLAVYRELSEYIHHSIVVDRHSIWIAQREGRAKDGWDRTEPAIVKMLCISKPKDMSLTDYIRRLRIVPVAVSYEWDPCDASKARELETRDRAGSYEKGEQEDVRSIAQSITSPKGEVCVSFGHPITQEFTSVDEVAEEIDRQILGMYAIHASNIAAYRMLNGELPAGFADVEGLVEAEQELQRRLDALPQAQRPYLLAMYANPLVNRASISSAPAR
jgi:Acyltransferase